MDCALPGSALWEEQHGEDGNESASQDGDQLSELPEDNANSHGDFAPAEEIEHPGTKTPSIAGEPMEDVQFSTPISMIGTPTPSKRKASPGLVTPTKKTKVDGRSQRHVHQATTYFRQNIIAKGNVAAEISEDEYLERLPKGYWESTRPAEFLKNMTNQEHVRGAASTKNATKGPAVVAHLQAIYEDILVYNETNAKRFRMLRSSLGATFSHVHGRTSAVRMLQNIVVAHFKEMEQNIKDLKNLHRLGESAKCVPPDRADRPRHLLDTFEWKLATFKRDWETFLEGVQ